MAIHSKESNFDTEISEQSAFPRLFGVFFIIIFITLSVYGMKYMLNPNTLPIKNVKVEGVFNRLSQNELKVNVINNIQGGFFNINVDKVRLALLNMPWVRNVTVKRVWPDSLKVVVNEQIPSARWGDLGLLNESGVFFSPDGKTIPNDLPLLFGPVNSEVKILNRYRAIQEKLQSLPFRLNVSSVTLNDRRAWSFGLENGVRIIIGRYSFDDRLNRFLKFVPTLIPDGINKIQSVDLRYSNGLSVLPKNNINISSN